MADSDRASRSFHQSTLFWGSSSTFVTIVVTVVAAMIKDLRPLLALAWPFAIFAVWEFARAWGSRRQIAWITGIGTAVSTGGLVVLYLWLAPTASNPAQIPESSASPRADALKPSIAAIEATRRLPVADRERLADALYDLSKLFDDRVWRSANTVVAQILSNDNDDSKPISANLKTYEEQLANLSADVHDYRKRLAEVQDRWKYYSLQFYYIIGNDPDHGERGLEEAVDGFAADFDRWSKIQNVDDHPMREFLNFSQNAFNGSLSKFANWQVYCDRRLQQIKNVLQR